MRRKKNECGATPLIIKGVGRIYSVLHLMAGSYEKVREAFVARLLDSIRMRSNPDAVLAQFCSAVTG